MPAICALALTGCAAFRPSTEAPIVLATLPEQVKSCADPVPLPDRALSRAEVESLWAHDRVALAKCGLSLNALVTHYQVLAEALAEAAK